MTQRGDSVALLFIGDSLCCWSLKAACGKHRPYRWLLGIGPLSEICKTHEESISRAEDAVRQRGVIYQFVGSLFCRRPLVLIELEGGLG